MAKDPAFLFYTSDFLTGTMFMSHEQVGLYVRLLCAQHQHDGVIPEDVMQMQCKSIANGDAVLVKFTKTEHGYANLRLTQEMEKRSQINLKRSQSALIRWENAKCKSIANAMRIENENENENDIEIVKDRDARERKKLSTFRNSNVFDRELFKSKFEAKYQVYDLDHYYDSALNWSDSGDKKKLNWVATVKTWITRDIKQKQAKLKYDDIDNQKIGRSTTRAMRDFATDRTFSSVDGHQS